LPSIDYGKWSCNQETRFSWRHTQGPKPEVVASTIHMPIPDWSYLKEAESDP